MAMAARAAMKKEKACLNRLYLYVHSMLPCRCSRGESDNSNDTPRGLSDERPQRKKKKKKKREWNDNETQTDRERGEGVKEEGGCD
jgi:hypothetical protein